MIDNETYYRTKEAAAYLRTSPSTLAKRRLYGTGPRYCRIGRAIRYRKSDLDDFMASTLQQSTFGRGKVMNASTIRLSQKRINPCASPSRQNAPSRPARTIFAELPRLSLRPKKKVHPKGLIADSIGKSPAWVNGLLRWRASGYRDRKPLLGRSPRPVANVLVFRRTKRTEKTKKNLATEQRRTNSPQLSPARRPCMPKQPKPEPRRRELSFGLQY